LFLAVPGSEEDTPGGAEALCLPQSGDLQHRSDPGCVIVGPVHDRSVRLAAQVVVVRADDDDLVAELGIGAREKGQHVAGLDRLLLLQTHSQRRGCGEWGGSEA